MTPELGIYRRKQENKKTRKTRNKEKHKNLTKKAIKKKRFFFPFFLGRFLVRGLVFVLFFLFSWSSSCFLTFLFSFISFHLWSMGRIRAQFFWTFRIYDFFFVRFSFNFLTYYYYFLSSSISRGPLISSLHTVPLSPSIYDQFLPLNFEVLIKFGLANLGKTVVILIFASLNATQGTWRHMKQPQDVP